MHPLTPPAAACARWARPLLLAATLAAAGAHAAPARDLFPPSVQLQGSLLQLNGAGTRHRAIFDVYELALYTPRKVRGVEDLFTLPGPKRLQFVALREISTTDIGRQFVRSMSDNSSKEQVLRHTEATTRLIELFSRKPRIAKGEDFAIDFVPGRGVVFSLLGEPQGEPFGDADFYTMVLRIWFGPRPVDTQLKDALLGIEKEKD